MNIKKELETKVGIASDIYLNDIDINPLTIKAIMIVVRQIKRSDIRHIKSGLIHGI